MSTQTLGTLADFIAAHKISMSVDYADSNPNMADGHNMNHFSCQLRMGRKRLTVRFSQGYGIQGEPTITSVLDCLASDSAGFDNAQSFEDWASEYGYDTDSRTAERTFKTVERQADKLKAFLGPEAYETLLFNTERE
jgi:hypothetical protein